MEIDKSQFISMLREISVASNREIRNILIRTISVHGEFDSDDFLIRRLAKFAIQFLTDEGCEINCTTKNAKGDMRLDIPPLETQSVYR